jgi:transmembrane sensor
MDKDSFRTSVKALLEGRATPLQKSLIEASLGLEEYKELYFLFVEEWELQNPQLITNPDAAFKRWSERGDSGAWEQRKTHKKQQFWKKSGLWIAASVSVFMLVGVFFNDVILNKTVGTSYGELKTILLNDGSIVTLNGNSTLRTSRFGFGKANRNVFLKGEAEFVVSHLPGATPFFVRTPDSLEVKVLGTKFVVYAREKGSRVALSEGKVELRASGKRDGAPISMKPGDVISISKEGELAWAHDQPEEIYNAWKHHRFSFDNTPLSEIANQLKEVFGVQIIIPDSALAKRAIGGTFQAESADKVLHILADILEVRLIPDSSSPSKTYTITY